jgi:hypothetical protein
VCVCVLQCSEFYRQSLPEKSGSNWTGLVPHSAAECGPALMVEAVANHDLEARS